MKKLINSIKWKRKANKYENNYKSALEEISPLKDKIIELQKNNISLLEKTAKLKEEIYYFKNKYEKKELKNEKSK